MLVRNQDETVRATDQQAAAADRRLYRLQLPARLLLSRHLCRRAGERSSSQAINPRSQRVAHATHTPNSRTKSSSLIIDDSAFILDSQCVFSVLEKSEEGDRMFLFSNWHVQRKGEVALRLEWSKSEAWNLF